MTPVILLDVDGVINAITKKPNRSIWPVASWRSGWALCSGKEWPITWSVEVIEFLTRVHVEGRAEIRWHTTWQHEAKNLADLVGLPKFPVALAPEAPRDDVPNGELIAARMRDGLPAWWKYGAARRVVIEEGRPLLWIDDDITYELNRRERGVMSLMGAVQLISPSQETGLIPRHLREIEAFLQNWPATDTTDDPEEN